MIDAKSELQYLLIVRLLEDMAGDGLLNPEELDTAKQLAEEKYCPCFVWE